MNNAYFNKKGFSISTDKSLLNRGMIHQYLNGESYWAAGISIEIMSLSIENALCFGIYKDETQVGFARVITDQATFAYVCDVFVLPSYRRLGLSKWLIQTIVNYPQLQGLRRWSLATADAHGLYRQFGFKELIRPEVWMEILTPYQKNNER